MNRARAGRPFEVRVRLEERGDFAFRAFVAVRGQVTGEGLANDRSAAVRAAVFAHHFRIGEVFVPRGVTKLHAVTSAAGKVGLLMLFVLGCSSSPASSSEPPDYDCGQLYRCCASLTLTEEEAGFCTRTVDEEEDGLCRSTLESFIESGQCSAKLLDGGL